MERHILAGPLKIFISTVANVYESDYWSCTESDDVTRKQPNFVVNVYPELKYADLIQFEATFTTARRFQSKYVRRRRKQPQIWQFLGQFYDGA